MKSTKLTEEETIRQGNEGRTRKGKETSTFSSSSVSHSQFSRCISDVFIVINRPPEKKQKEKKEGEDAEKLKQGEEKENRKRRERRKKRN